MTHPGKNAALAALGAAPTAERRAVTVDLREDWPAALRAAGFDPSAPTAWIAEGLLIYLPPEAQDKLFDNITALSTPGSRLATEFHTDHGAGMRERGAAMSERWRGAGLDLNLTDLWYQGERTSVVEHLDASGWNTTARPRLEVFAEYGRPLAETEDTAALRNSLSVTATKN